MLLLNLVFQSPVSVPLVLDSSPKIVERCRYLCKNYPEEAAGFLYESHLGFVEAVCVENYFHLELEFGLKWVLVVAEQFEHGFLKH